MAQQQHTPCGLLSYALDAGAIPRDQTFEIFVAAGTFPGATMVHTSRFCAPEGAQHTPVSAPELAARIDSIRAQSQLCPFCAAGLEQFGILLADTDVAALRSLDDADRAFRPQATEGAGSQARALLDALVGQVRPDHPELRRHYERFLAEIPQSLDQVRGTDQYRKSVLRACLNGLQRLRNQLADRGRVDDRDTPLLAALQEVLGPLLDVETAGHHVDVGAPFTDAETQLYQELTAPTSWVAPRRVDAMHFYQFALDVTADLPSLVVKVPTLVLVSGRLTAYAYWFTVGTDVTRWQASAAYALVREERLTQCRRLDAYVTAVQNASA